MRLGAWILMDQAHEQQAGGSLFPLLPAESRAQARAPAWLCVTRMRPRSPDAGQGPAASPALPSCSSAGKRGQKDPSRCPLLAASVGDDKN